MEKKELLNQENIENERNLDEKEILPIIKDLDNKLVENFGIVDLSDRMAFVTLPIMSYRIDKSSLLRDTSVYIFRCVIEIEIENFIDEHEDEYSGLETMLKTFAKIKYNEDTEDEDVEPFIRNVIEASDFMDRMNWGYDEIVSEIYEYFNKCKE